MNSAVYSDKIIILRAFTRIETHKRILVICTMKAMQKNKIKKNSQIRNESSSRCTCRQQAFLISHGDTISSPHPPKKWSLFTEYKNCLGLFSHIFHTLWHENGAFHLQASALLEHLIHKMAEDNQIVSDKRLTIRSAEKHVPLTDVLWDFISPSTWIRWQYCCC